MFQLSMESRYKQSYPKDQESLLALSCKPGQVQLNNVIIVNYTRSSVIPVWFKHLPS